MKPASTEPDDEALLVGRLRDSDPEAFETVVREYGGRMLAAARRLVGTEEDARDAVQEAFLAAFKSIHSFAGAARLSTWLHRIVVNAALMKLRSRRRRREDSIEDLLPRFRDDGCWSESPATWGMPSDGVLERRETRTVVRRAIERLPASYRTVLMLRDIEELDTDETATALGTTRNAVKIRLHRARQALKSLLDRELLGHGEPIASARNSMTARPVRMAKIGRGGKRKRRVKVAADRSLHPRGRSIGPYARLGDHDAGPHFTRRERPGAQPPVLRRGAGSARPCPDRGL